MAPRNGESTVIPVAYISFSTVTGLLDRLSEGGVPHRIDPSFLDNYAGGYRPTILASLRALGLIDSAGTPTDVLDALVQADDPQRRKLVGELVRAHYGFLLKLPSNATQSQMEEAFEQVGVRGDTRRKAAAFFLKACEFGGVSVSALWRVPKVPSSAARRPSRRASAAGDVPAEPLAVAPPVPAIGDGLPAEIVGLLRKIPKEGETWPPSDRRRFTVALEALFDLFYTDSVSPQPEPALDGG
ncbi:DUF5343 domain-containing protein [Plantactinospora sp. WMMB334]|uniref:DUF5343 domain-containing protein n=1 Tax=Plantactinospora sp. WMMB334 TaxID=3404119 RepID=UPI003B93010F